MPGPLDKGLIQIWKYVFLEKMQADMKGPNSLRLSKNLVAGLHSLQTEQINGNQLAKRLVKNVDRYYF